MERPKLFPTKLYSLNLLSKFKSKDKKTIEDLEKEKEPPQCRIVLNRSGNLSNDTKLDQEKADDYMRTSDVRRDIFIVDSDRRPENETVRIGSDTLAFRIIEPIEKFTRMNIKSPTFTLLEQERKFEIQVHERIIDDEVRKKHPTDSSDYKKKFLELLNKTVSHALEEGLFFEKLSWEQYSALYLLLVNFFAAFNYIDLVKYGHPEVIKALIATYLVGVVSNFGIKLNHVYPEANPLCRNNWNEIWLPLIPFDKYLAGKYFLFRHGKSLIIPRNTSVSPISH